MHRFDEDIQLARRLNDPGQEQLQWIFEPSLTFRDKAGCAHMTKSDGQEDSFDKMADYLRSFARDARSCG